jgi:hypothetical protein
MMAEEGMGMSFDIEDYDYGDGFTLNPFAWTSLHITGFYVWLIILGIMGLFSLFGEDRWKVVKSEGKSKKTQEELESESLKRIKRLLLKGAIYLSIIFIVIVTAAIHKKNGEPEKADIVEFISIDIFGDFEINATKLENYRRDAKEYYLDDWGTQHANLIYKNKYLVEQVYYSDYDDEFYHVYDSVSYLDFGKVFWLSKDSVFYYPPGSEFDKKQVLRERAYTQLISDKIIIVLFGGSGWINTRYKIDDNELEFGSYGYKYRIVHEDEFHNKVPEFPIRVELNK